METIENRKGICPNIGSCSKANSREEQLIADPFAEFKCSECKTLLEEVVKDNGKRKIPKWVLPASIGIIVLGLLAVFLPPLFRTDNIKDTIEKEEPLIFSPDSIPSLTDNNSEMPELSNVNPEPKAKLIESKTSTTEEDVLIASTLEDSLNKIGNPVYSQASRKALISEILKKFESVSIPVKVLKGTDEYEYFKVEDYLDRILIQKIYNISVVKQTNNNSGLITELIVSEK